MKERWLYSDYIDCETEKPVYYKKKQRLTWQFYLRIVKKWFTPCDKCQENFDNYWKPNILFAKTREVIKDILRKWTCSQCYDKIRKLIKDGEVILGNKDYEPPVELQRRWIDVMERNKNGVLDLVSENVTKKEYYKVKGWKL